MRKKILKTTVKQISPRRISKKKTDSENRKNAASEDSFYVTARSMVW